MYTCGHWDRSSIKWECRFMKEWNQRRWGFNDTLNTKFLCGDLTRLEFSSLISFVFTCTMFFLERILLEYRRLTNPRKCLWNINSASSAVCWFYCINRFNLHLKQMMSKTSSNDPNNWWIWREINSYMMSSTILQTRKCLGYFKWKHRMHAYRWRDSRNVQSDGFDRI